MSKSWELDKAAFIKVLGTQVTRPTRCPSCGGPLTAMRPGDISGVPRLGLICDPCYRETGEA